MQLILHRDRNTARKRTHIKNVIVLWNNQEKLYLWRVIILKRKLRIEVCNATDYQ